MKEIKTIQVDGRYPEYRMKELGVYLQDGWVIIDKTIIKDRFVNYVLTKFNDPDLGKSGTPLVNQTQSI
jgi:hypothetical protein